MMRTLLDKLQCFLHSEDGPTAVEYAVLLAVIMGAMIVTMSTFGEQVNGLYVTIREATQSA